MHFAHLCSSFLSLQNRRYFPSPPSTRLLPLWRIHCFYTVYHKDGISVWGTARSQEPYQENMGDKEGFQIKIQSKQSWQSVFLAFFLRFRGVAASICPLICTFYRATLLKIINHDNTLTIPKDWGHHRPCWMNPLRFFRRGWERVFPLFALQFWLWVKVVNPCLTP